MTALTRWSWIFALIGGALLLAAGSTWFVTGTGEGWPTRFAVGSALSLLVWLALDRARLADLVSSRAFVYGSGAWLLIGLAGGLAIGGYTLARKHDETWDFSKDQAWTISDHTRSVVAGMEESVTVLGFFRKQSEAQRDFANLMRLYQEAGPRLTVQYLDPLQSPRLAEKYDVTTDVGTILLERVDPATGETKSRRITTVEEDAITDALVLLLSDAEHRICWSLGHGEPEPDDEFDQEGLGAFVVLLEGANYQVTKTRIAQEGIDRACEVLVMARPSAEPFPYEREAIAAYVAEGGRFLLLIEPLSVPDLAADLERYGMKLALDLVVDADPRNTFMGVSDPSVVVLSGENLGSHEITSSFAAAVVLPGARSVTPVDPPPEGLKTTVLMRTSPQAWGELNAEGGAVEPDPATEVIGEIAVAVLTEVEDPAVLEVAPHTDVAADSPLDVVGDPGRAVPADLAPKPGGRVVVIGDSDFLGNAALGLGNNKDLGLNTLAWLVGETAQIGERPEEGDKLTITSLGEAVSCLVSIVFVPGAAMALAAITLLRRRFL
ncbi:MAG: Gldg family protein [Deltaproteobacteria bacterium]|nr:Gldg family protein [Deltaproteobacteria bacterium]